MNQKLIQSNGQSWLILTVPENAGGFTLVGNEHSMAIRYTLMTNPGKFKFPEIDLHPGSYTIYGKGSDLSEEQWREIVEEASNEYYTGGKDYSGNVSAFHSFTESGLSLLSHHGFKPNGCVILKVVK